MLVTRVREGFAATPPHDAVARVVSTKVIVVVATATGTGTVAAAATADGVPTTASPVAERRRPKPTTLSKKG
jgi:hypothetical protein